MRNGRFADPRLVAVHDAEHVWGWDDDLFMSLLAERMAPRVLDFGCGTGRLAIAMAAAGHEVTGVDPEPAALTAARGKPGAERVHWLTGGAEQVLPGRYEAVLVTGHVAQSLGGDGEWAEALRAWRRALVPGGRLILDSADPQFRPWDHWDPAGTRRTIVLPDGSEVTAWSALTSADPPLIDVEHHCVLPGGDHLVTTETVRFRTEQELRATVEAAGFDVDRIYGGWSREPAGRSIDGELIMIAVARPLIVT